MIACHFGFIHTQKANDKTENLIKKKVILFLSFNESFWLHNGVFVVLFGLGLWLAFALSSKRSYCVNEHFPKLKRMKIFQQKNSTLNGKY